jgi:hypothetical protein
MWTTNGDIAVQSQDGELAIEDAGAGGGGSIKLATLRSGAVLVGSVMTTGDVEIQSADAIHEFGSDAASDIAARSVVMIAAGAVGVQPLNYAVQASDDLVNWMTIAIESALDYAGVYTTSTPPNGRFFRVVSADPSAEAARVTSRVRMLPDGNIQLDWARGAAAGMEIDAESLRAEVGSSVHVTDLSGGLELVNAETLAGFVRVHAMGGALQARNVAAAQGAIHLETTGAGADLLVDRISTAGHVDLDSAGAIRELGEDGTSDVSAGSLAVKGGSGICLAEYQVEVQFSSDLANWTTLQVLDAASASDSAQFAMPEGARFLRVRQVEGGSVADAELTSSMRLLPSGEVQVAWIRTSRAEALEFSAVSLAHAEAHSGGGIQLYDLARQQFVIDPVLAGVAQSQPAP